MSEEQKAREEEVFDQELSLNDLDAAAGGSSESWRECGGKTFLYFRGGPIDDDTSNCVMHEKRNIYGGNGFPNCAATVEDGSHCANNDACYTTAVEYHPSLTDCKKAWH